MGSLAEESTSDSFVVEKKIANPTDYSSVASSDSDKDPEKDPEKAGLGINVENIKIQSLKLQAAQKKFEKYNKYLNGSLNGIAVLSLITGSVLIALIWSVRGILNTAVQTDFSSRSLVGNLTYLDEYTFLTAEVLLVDPDNTDLWTTRWEEGVEEHDSVFVTLEDLQPDLQSNFEEYEIIKAEVVDTESEAIATGDAEILLESEYLQLEQTLLDELAVITGRLEVQSKLDREEADEFLEITLGILIFDLIFFGISMLFIHKLRSIRRNQRIVVRKEILKSQEMLRAITEQEAADDIQVAEITTEAMDVVESKISLKFSKILGIFSAFVITISAVLLYCDQTLNNLVVDHFAVDYQLLGLHGNLLLYDEVLTMSTRAAALGGSEVFVERNINAKQPLLDTIDEIERLFPDIENALETEIRFSREQLFLLQDEVNDIVQQQNLLPEEDRDLSEAAAIVNSDEFNDYTESLLRGASIVFVFLEAQTTSALETANVLAILSIVFVMLWIPFNLIRFFFTRENQKSMERQEKVDNLALEWNLRRLMKNQDTRPMLVRFAKKQFCAEHIDFDNEISIWILKAEQGNITQNDLQNSLRSMSQIYNEFLVEGSSSQVNVSARVVRRIATVIADLRKLEAETGKIDGQVFNKLRLLAADARGESISLLEDNIHIKFINCEEFETFLDGRDSAIQQQIKIIELYSRGGKTGNVVDKNKAAADRAAVIDMEQV